MRRLLYLFALLLLLFAACSPSKDEGAKAAEAAQEYYQKLFEGDYRSFVEAHHNHRFMPEAYRKQMVDNAKMFVFKMRSEKEGIDSVLVTKGIFHDTDSTAEAFLILKFGNREREQIVVPMIFADHKWLLR